ncbi:hypothetical protein VZT92_021119 [Zoarces viviparus]|uniref:Uncharacterized protein n=1 Tax=Zoarces viviparus TaxID=48416 RepID=A0AAW1EFP6_ZOAVI
MESSRAKRGLCSNRSAATGSGDEEDTGTGRDLQGARGTLRGCGSHGFHPPPSEGPKVRPPSAALRLARGHFSPASS